MTQRLDTEACAHVSAINFLSIFLDETLPHGILILVMVYMITQEWGAAGDIDNLNLTWHVPSLEELELTDRLLHTFLTPEIQRLRSFMGGQTMDRFVESIMHACTWFVHVYIEGGCHRTIDFVSDAEKQPPFLNCFKLAVSTYVRYRISFCT